MPSRIAYLVLFVLGSSYAQAPEIAVCKEGQCVMPQTTYLELKMLVARIVRADAERQDKLESTEHSLTSCEAALKDART